MHKLTNGIVYTFIRFAKFHGIFYVHAVGAVGVEIKNIGRIDLPMIGDIRVKTAGLLVGFCGASVAWGLD